ncbi:MAG TPA: thioredoxin-disulfide reductase [Candidatus Hodarchaeales archaeon]|nr:thioredoxin-disulfide reductase [Candidatus Hodarchaeales archaeon]
MTEIKHKVIIIGSGPAGLTAGIYAGRANLDPLIAAGEVQATQLPGGQLMLTTEVENFPGFPEGVQGPELMNRMIEQAKRFGAEMIEEFATGLKRNSDGSFEVKVGQETFRSHAVILAMGANAKWLNAPGEEKYRNKGISACATCDGPLPVFRNKEIYVVGGGDSAMEESLFLTKFAKQVTIVHRRNEFRASKIMTQRVLSSPKIRVLWDSTISGYEGKDYLEAIKIKNLKTNRTETHSIGGLFMAIGHEPATEFLKTGNLIELDSKGYVKIIDHVKTNVEGIFAAGDVHDTHFRQAITAAGFGCMAAILCERWLDEKGLH